MMGTNSEIKVIQEYTERFAKCDLSMHIEMDNIKKLDIIAKDINNWAGLLNTYIRDVSEILAHLSAGDLTASLSNEDSFKGDFIPIKNALKKITKSLNKIFGKINIVMNNLEKISEENKEQTQQVAENAVIQTRNIKALSDEINMVFEKTEENQKNIGIVYDYISEAKVESEKGKNSIAQMLNSISKVQSAVENINNVTEFIESISRQTKILSINASIEASRAGAAGKGFAVVANEIGSLARQTSDSVQKTAELIEESISQVKISSEIAKETSNSFNSIQNSIDKVSDKNEVIVEDTKYQTESIKRIVSIVDSISAKIGHDARFAKKNAESNEALISDIRELKELLAYFVLEGQAENRMISINVIDNVVDKFIGSFQARVASGKSFNDILCGIVSQSEIVECAYILDESGIQASDTIMNHLLRNELSDGFKPAQAGYDHSNKKYYIQTMKNQNIVHSSIEYISGATGSLCKTFSTVFNRDGAKFILCVDVKCMN